MRAWSFHTYYFNRGSSLILTTLTFLGKSVAYVPYAEVTRALGQEAQMHSPAARSASPCRLSPREVSKAAPQPGMSAARSSVPPGKYPPPCGGCWASTQRRSTWVDYSHDWAACPGHVLAVSERLPCFSTFHHQLYSVQIHWAKGSVCSQLYPVSLASFAFGEKKKCIL